MNRRYAAALRSNPELDRLDVAIAQAPSMERRRFLRDKGYPHFIYKYRGLKSADGCGVEQCAWKLRAISERSVDQLRDYLVRSELWLSAPIDFNDPFDVSAELVADGSLAERREKFTKGIKTRFPNLTWKERERRIAEWMAKPPEELKAVLQRSFDNQRRSMGVCSFAGNPKDILMWSHYGQDHSGVCLQFRVGGDPRTFIRAVKIDYCDDYPRLNWITDFADNILGALLRKSTHWDYEKERRIAIPDEAHKYLKFLPKALTGIILGSRASKETAEVVAALLSERRSAGLPEVTVYKARLHPKRYRLIVERER